MIIHPRNYPAYPHIQIGGKAKGLLHLHQMGYNVPEWCVIPEEFQRSCLERVGLTKSSTVEYQKAIREVDLVGNLIPMLREYFNFQPGMRFAVRSSASEEDGMQHSFAGQYNSYLYVSPENLAEKVKAVWLSAFSDTLQTYQKISGKDQAPFLSVVIQRMVDAEVSGVAFGANPITGNPTEKLINAVYGMGEGLVSGDLNSDTFILNSDQRIQEYPTVKDRELRAFEGELQYVEIPESRKSTLTLTKSQIQEVGSVLDGLYQRYETFQDIEFAYEKGQLFLLQARPITNLEKLPSDASHSQIWDNSNIIESYPGQTSPLTFSFILKVYRAVYIQFSELMGVDKRLISQHDAVFKHMLGLIQGRVYYNLLNWYKALSLFPGYRVNKKFMEQMMGVKESIQEEVEIPSSDSRAKATRKLLLSIIRIIYAFVALGKERKKFQSYLKEIIPSYRKISFESLPVHESLNHYARFESVLLERWRAPLINDFFAMIFFGLLKKHTENIAPDHPNLCNDLLIGSHDIISVEPARHIQKILQQIRSHPSCREFFQTKTAIEIWNQVSLLPSQVQSGIAYYLEHFGDRSTGELKLETQTFSTHPEAFIELLQSQLDFEVDLNEMGAKGRKRRKMAERTLKSRLKRRPFYRPFILWVLKHARSLVSNRENLRFERTRAFGVVRKIFGGIGQQFYQQGIIDQPEDIFFLQQEEIFAYIQGTSVQSNVRPLVALRKKEYRENEKVEMAARIKTWGMPYMRDSYSTEETQLGPSDLKGWGCSPGIVEGEVLVVQSPQETRNAEGKIVVCECTDPGWITLFATCSGLIVQRGSLLSHSAIVSREMGIPCIVSVPNVLQQLASGDWVKMDGSTGEIHLQTPQTLPYEKV
ncbi:MAG: PEP/pyruvate-binding domain-containing protein [Bacteroidota bacterium]